MSLLLESDFLTVNLKAFSTGAPDDNTPSNTADSADKPEQSAEGGVSGGNVETPKKYPADFDWEKELNRRVEANKKLSPESRETDQAIEKRFWFEYFSAGWGVALAKLLMQIGSLMQNDIKLFGFDKQTNPVIGFLNRPYVKKELIATKLLNSNTYKCIHTAISKKLIADSEFFNVSNYNILYCRDLYTKSASDIVKYLELQKSILTASQGKYTVGQQNANKRAFIQILKPTNASTSAIVSKINSIPDADLRAISVTNKSAKLNNIELAQLIINKHRPKAARADVSIKPEIQNKLNKFAENIKGPAQILASIQYLSMTTGSEKARNALSDSKFSSVSINDLKDATPQISKLFSKVKGLSPAMADALIDILLNK